MKNNTRSIVLIGLLLGLNIVFSRFISISAWSFKIGFTFLTVLVAAYISGIPGACLVAGLGDFIGALLFPIGPYNPGFTFSAILTGIIYGAFFKGDFDNKKMIIAVLLNQIAVSLLFNSLLISILYKANFWALLTGTRLPQSLVMIVVEFITIRLIKPVLPRLKRLVNE